MTTKNSYSTNKHNIYNQSTTYFFKMFKKKENKKTRNLLSYRFYLLCKANTKYNICPRKDTLLSVIKMVEFCIACKVFLF